MSLIISLNTANGYLLQISKVLSSPNPVSYSLQEDTSARPEEPRLSRANGKTVSVVCLNHSTYCIFSGQKVTTQFDQLGSCFPSQTSLNFVNSRYTYVL